MHSSRMSTVICSGRPRGRGFCWGDLPAGVEVCLPPGGRGRGVCLRGCLPRGLWDRMTDTCKNIHYLAATTLRTVKMSYMYEDVNRRTTEIPQRTHSLNVHNVPFKLAVVNLVQSCVKIWRFRHSFYNTYFFYVIWVFPILNLKLD